MALKYESSGKRWEQVGPTGGLEGMGRHLRQGEGRLPGGPAGMKGGNDFPEAPAYPGQADGSGKSSISNGLGRPRPPVFGRGGRTLSELGRHGQRDVRLLPCAVQCSSPSQRPHLQFPPSPEQGPGHQQDGVQLCQSRPPLEVSLPGGSERE